MEKEKSLAFERGFSFFCLGNNHRLPHSNRLPLAIGMGSRAARTLLKIPAPAVASAGKNTSRNGPE